MSAFMCSKDHINALVTYAYQNDLSVYYDGKSVNANKNPQTWVEELTLCNRNSITARYGEKFDEPIPAFERKLIRASSAQIAKLCHCFHYQACEQEDYELTRGFRMINAVSDHLLRGLKGYEDAEWAI